MKYRYASGWVRSNPLARALTLLCPWRRLTCRVGGFWPGLSDPVPEGPAGGDFREIARAEARSLWQRYGEIAVMWSGGVDSSLLACLLAEARPATGRLLLVSEAHTFDWPEHKVLAWLRASGCETLEATTDTLRAVVERGGMLVAGYHADTLLCGDIVRYHDLYVDIWHLSVEAMFVRVTGLPAPAVRRALEDLEPLLALMPVPRTAANVAWWLDFTCAWNSDEMALKYLFDLDPPGQGYLNFFGAPAFQLWSMQDVAQKVGRTAETHKQVYLGLVEEIIGFAPDLPLRTEPGETFGTPMDMDRVLAIREDWSLIESPV